MKAWSKCVESCHHGQPLRDHAEREADPLPPDRRAPQEGLTMNFEFAFGFFAGVGATLVAGLGVAAVLLTVAKVYP